MTYAIIDDVLSISATIKTKPMSLLSTSDVIETLKSIENRQVQKVIKMMLQTNARLDSFRVPSPEKEKGAKPRNLEA
jgi:thioester reductase-like protein